MIYIEDTRWRPQRPSSLPETQTGRHRQAECMATPCPQGFMNTVSDRSRGVLTRTKTARPIWEFPVKQAKRLVRFVLGITCSSAGIWAVLFGMIRYLQVLKSSLCFFPYKNMPICPSVSTGPWTPKDVPNTGFVSASKFCIHIEATGEKKDIVIIKHWQKLRKWISVASSPPC